MNNLSGKIVLITGGTRGIGKAITESLLSKGADIIVIGKNKINFFKDKIYSKRIKYISCDLSDNLDLQKLSILKDYKIDILINNAGNQERESFLNYSLNQWNKDIQLLLTSVFQISQLVSRSIIQNGIKGRIINIGSISSFQGAKNIVGYITAKHGLIGLTKAMAVELAPYNINVNCISPGMINTDLLNKFEYDKEIVKRIPLGTIGVPEDIVGTVLYLCSEASNYVTGVNIPVDGGWLAR
jgi:NAD(P)-dependent dehydrogenase (short-subunit alcohol dehydrogenase family)